MLKPVSERSRQDLFSSVRDVSILQHHRLTVILDPTTTALEKATEIMGALSRLYQAVLHKDSVTGWPVPDPKPTFIKKIRLDLVDHIALSSIEEMMNTRFEQRDPVLNIYRKYPSVKEALNIKRTKLSCCLLKSRSLKEVERALLNK